MPLLSDENIREFIVNGFIIIKPNVKPSIHKEIDNLLRFITENEFLMGNNIMARIPLLWEILRCSKIDGALTSLLGKNYYITPHRAVHRNVPVENIPENIRTDENGPKLGKGSTAGSDWHQDAHSPLSKSRHHLIKSLIGFYFPHDTPEKMGPTRIQAGSHLFSHPGIPRNIIIPNFLNAGTFILLHFDIIHAAWINHSFKDRFMIKFVFTRTENPKNAEWNNKDLEWFPPKKTLTNFDHNKAWNFIWNWMQGSKLNLNISANNYNLLINMLNSDNQENRLNAIYSLANENHILKLADCILSLRGKNLHNRLLQKNEQGLTIPKDNINDYPRRWNERAILCDDASFALAAIGRPAVPMLIELVKNKDPWIIINGLFALGEIGPEAKIAIPTISNLLLHPLHQVVRQALEALENIQSDINLALSNIENLLMANNQNWKSPEVFRGWTGQDQVRLNAVSAINSCYKKTKNKSKLESILTKALKDENGYVAAVACECLLRMNTNSSIKFALNYLNDRRWDDTLLGGTKVY